jgi:citrate lyase subunit beta/citryl-CoA lyase
MAIVGDVRGAFLSVPGSRPDLFAKAAGSGATGIILDLEDAVAPTQKADARRAVVDWIETVQSVPVVVVVRVNQSSSEWFEDDLAALAAASGASRVVMIPKLEDAAELRAADRFLDGGAGGSLTTLMGLIESARGVQRAGELALASRRLVALSLGFADLAVSLGRPTPRDTALWRSIRDRVLVAARVAGILAIDGPYLGVTVDDDFREDVAEAASLGFDAKWVIHPGQVAEVSRALQSTPEAIEWAHRIVEALDRAVARGDGVISVDGLMVDEAVALGARQLLDRVGRSDG